MLDIDLVARLAKPHKLIHKCAKKKKAKSEAKSDLFSEKKPRILAIIPLPLEHIVDHTFILTCPESQINIYFMKFDYSTIFETE